MVLRAFRGGADSPTEAIGSQTDLVQLYDATDGHPYKATVQSVTVAPSATPGTVEASEVVIVDSNKDITGFRNITATGEISAVTLDIGGTNITATAAELNYNDIATLGTGAASKAIVLDGTGNYTFPASHTFRASMVTLTATAAITALLHSNRICYITGTAAAAYTLPEATGTGDRYTFIMGQVNTNGTTFVAADTTNCSYHGTINLLDVDAAAQTAYFTATAGGTDTVTFDGTTKGGQIGDMVTFVDIATDVWHVHGEARVPAGSNPATPFSSAA